MDAHNKQSDEVDWLKSKVTDLEDHSRRNVNIPESVQPAQLHQCASELIYHVKDQSMMAYSEKERLTVLPEFVG